ncbi:MAG: ABC transporter ATP-binding protein [Rhodospirillales bacterium]|nr:ABC transporter ATP-binding protein [Rhodospirillales bacterium]
MTLLSVERLSVGEGAFLALDEVSLSLGRGEALALLGANGAGKTTLLRALVGLAPVRSGTIRIDGEDVTRLPPERRARLGIGYVPEGRRVFPGMSVRDNLEVAAREGAAARRRLLAEVYELFPDLAAREETAAWQLSGGQQQMLAIGRALMTRPKLLLLDEPSLGLAPKLAAELFARIATIAEGGTAVLLAEQNVARAARVASRAVLLRLGRVIAEGDAAALAASPELHDAFFGA